MWTKKNFQLKIKLPLLHVLCVIDAKCWKWYIKRKTYCPISLTVPLHPTLPYTFFLGFFIIWTLFCMYCSFIAKFTEKLNLQFISCETWKIEQLIQYKLWNLVKAKILSTNGWHNQKLTGNLLHNAQWRSYRSFRILRIDKIQYLVKFCELFFLI